MGELLLLATLEAGLTPGQREAFIDTQIMGRTSREVAAYMGCSHSNVRLLTDRARANLSGSPIVTDLRAAT